MSTRIAILQLKPKETDEITLLHLQNHFREALLQDPNLVFVSPSLFSNSLSSKSFIFHSLQELTAEADTWLILPHTLWNNREQNLVLSPEGDLLSKQIHEYDTAWGSIQFNPQINETASDSASFICLNDPSLLISRNTHSQILTLQQGSALYDHEHRIRAHKPGGEGYLWADLS